MMRLALWTLALLATLAGTGCRQSNEKPKDRAIAQAWTGPVSLKLRAEVHPDSKPVATVKHGDPLEVLQVRRRFVRVRTPQGAEGWTEVRNLLGRERMDELTAMAKEVAKLPSQGEATVYEALNVHIEPSRPSTSFYQITEGMKVDVVGHQVVRRSNALPPAPFTLTKSKPAPRKKKERKTDVVAPPPRPPGPTLPSNWRELSVSTLPPGPPEPPPPTVPMEDWSLVRTKDGHAGWVLTRNLVMAIPDEVAQYSEGARISSYFVLGDVQDGDQTKHHWIWTTIRDGGKPYQFDSFRVFIYMLRRHRYETAYIERGVEGYYPVEVERGANPRFSLVLRGADGRLYKKTWALEGYVTRKVAEQPWEMSTRKADAQTDDEEAEEDESEPDDGSPGLVDRLKGLLGRK